MLQDILEYCVSIDFLINILDKDALDIIMKIKSCRYIRPN